jgi:hypothetical protein
MVLQVLDVQSKPVRNRKRTGNPPGTLRKRTGNTPGTLYEELGINFPSNFYHMRVDIMRLDGPYPVGLSRRSQHWATHTNSFRGE